MPAPRLNGWRGAGLLFLGLTCLARGWRYAVAIPHPLPSGLEALSIGGAIIRVLGALWFLAAILGIWSAFRLRDLAGVFALAFMHALWSAALLLGWLFYDGDWLSPWTTLGVFALIVCWSRMVNPPSKVPPDELEHLLEERRSSE